MTQFLTLLKLEFMNRSPKVRGGRVFPRILKWLFAILGLGLIGFLLLFAINSVVKVCVKANLENEFIIYYVFIIGLVQFLFGLSLTTKTLYFNTESDILKLPLGSQTIFSSMNWFSQQFFHFLFSLFLELQPAKVWFSIFYLFQTHFSYQSFHSFLDFCFQCLRCMSCHSLKISS